MSIDSRIAGDAYLARAGIPFAPYRMVDDLDTATAAAAELGYPIVLKAAGLVHKSDHRGVITGIAGAAELRAAVTDVRGRLGAAAEPLVLQRQVSGAEILVGIQREAAGAVLAVAAGGIHAEIFDDVAVALVPFGLDTARQLIERLRIHPLLRGHRGSAAADVEALADLLVRVAKLADRERDILELDLNPVMVGEPGFGVVAVDLRVRLGSLPARPARPPFSLSRMIDPLHIVVVGASPDPSKVGSRVVRHLLRHGFTGRLDIVHPSAKEIQGRDVRRTLADVVGTPDLVLLATPARAVAQLAGEVAALGAGGVVIHSSGFAESGEHGWLLQREVVQTLEERSIPVLGPNSMGIVAPANKLAASFAGNLSTDTLPGGRVAVVSSSGALGSCVTSRLMAEQIGLSAWIHLGNEASLDAADCLHWLAQDPRTTVVGLILEDIGDAERFIGATGALLRAAKPVVVYTLANTSGGRAAALTHTGAMVGSERIRQATLEAAGATVVPTLQLFEETLALVATSGLPLGPRLAALTASGGACAVIADQVAATDLVLPDVPDAAARTLAGVLPEFVGVRNPLDLSAQLMTDPSMLEAALRTLLDPDRFDAILVQLTTNADPAADVIANMIGDTARSAPIPIYVSRFGAKALAPRALATYAQAGIRILEAPDDAVKAIAALAAMRRAIQTRRHSSAPAN